MFGGSLGIDLPQQPWKLRISLLNFFSPSINFTLFTFSLLIMDLSKHIECLSKWSAHITPGLPTYGALFLLATGGLVIACKVWTFVRVLLSLFVLPGKPVRNWIFSPSNLLG